MVFITALFVYLYVSLATHELGHCMAMRLYRYSPESIQIGLGPTLFSATVCGVPCVGRLIPLAAELQPPAAMESAPWGARFLIAAAGPATSILVGILFSSLGRQVFYVALLGWVNLFLGLGNLLPVPGLDGAWMVSAVWDGIRSALRKRFRS